ncbi:co-chaperone GroES [Leuconostoc carnosum]|uniref:Co-chaperonin GroES n=2 Tax=Leuconostoc carnosum TaxID=1252 RepID=K0D8U6_LEUCJ|nr:MULTISPECIES: co-chaperone GroES [Leuconostoc]AFT81225.1 molecular chaperone GroES [Leuconostoc carnosum JB16]KAA8326558.1 co-chaperone GroES [Leuconostoc carnosum]KAA8330556.1 co-chaperone GroES [Leuconostoc carnosum]KAA8362118.1 co-chaperone GroES [Leuconostoc carnosum]KAA8366667.1 co-chaperone GroES [Leuconostoc carnosum]
MLKPLGDRVIIEVTEAAEQTVGGIVLASNAKDKPVTGKVVAVGTGYVLNDGKIRELSIEVGDEVLFDKYAGQEVSFEGTDYLALHEKDVVAVVE